MEIMAVPNPRAYVLTTEDKTTDCRTCIYGADCFERELIGENDNCETYVPNSTDFDFIKTIKSDAYREFAEKMYENIERNEGLYSGQEMPKMWASFAVQDTLDELESEL